MNILIIGPQASGKGTQAKLLVKDLKYQYFESGNILRKMAGEDTTLGRQVNQIINQKGKLVPDQQMVKIVKEWLVKNIGKQGIIFDGFPRNVTQFRLIEQFLSRYQQKFDRAFFLNVSQPITLKRLSSRRICPKCAIEYNLLTKPPKKKEICDYCQIQLIRRTDDTPEIIRKRLKTYYQLTTPLVGLLRQRGVLTEINGERPIEPIHQEILSFLKTQKH